MPHSYNFYKEDIKEWIIKNVPRHKRILDVGPGVGTYSTMLRTHGYRMDAVEIFAPYIKKYDLINKYDNVFVDDICKFDFKDYDFIILGDVLEHLHKEDAIDLYKRMVEQRKEFLVAVPWMMEQGEHEGNIYETHHQPDLTPEVLKKRYPKLKRAFENEYYGYYYHLNGKYDKAYLLYADSSYYDTVCAAVKSINANSNIPVIVYLLNDDRYVRGAMVVQNWNYDGLNIEQSEYIDRNNSDIYKLLIQRPAVIKHALNNFANTIAYIDSDTVVTPYIDRIFNYMPEGSTHPYFTEGIYDYLFINGRGGVETKEELHKSLEHPACELFGVDQLVRSKYRQTGYFVAGQSCFDFLEEWEWMCNHPKVLGNPQYYAPYHEETIANVLLWKYNIQDGLPYMYINYTKSVNVDDFIFTGKTEYLAEWIRLPAEKHQLLALHGEKRPEYMNATLNMQKKHILFLAPHLSTGGMPAFLLKRIQVLKNDYHVHVVEHRNYSDEYVVQKEQIKKIATSFHTLEKAQDIRDIIARKRISLVHIDEMAESLGDKELMDILYCNCRGYRIVETCHNISFDPNSKVYHPDAYAFCTPYHLETFEDTPTPIKEVLEFPIDKMSANKLSAMTQLGLDPVKKHVVNIGLWTRGKNQGEGLSMARKLPHVQFHFIGNQAVNFKEYWEPLMQNIPENVFVHGERNDTHLWLEAADVFMFNSTWECNPLVLREAISYGLPILARNLPQYKDMFTAYITDFDPMKGKNQLSKLLREGSDYQVPSNNTSDNFRNKHIEFYNHVLNKPKYKHIPVKDYKITQNFMLGPYLEITGTSQSKFRIEFYDEDKLIFDDNITCGHWVKLDRQYYTKWRTVVYKDDVLVMDEVMDLKDKNVLIGMESSSLGDTIAWIDYVLQFQILHGCRVTISTFKNFLFEEVYPELTFVKPGTVVNNIYAQYNIGWFYNKNKEPELPNTIPLQKTATNILGLEWNEAKPRIKNDFGNVCGMKDNYEVPGKYVTIATNSTAGCKFWTREGWQEVINYLHTNGFKVINTSIEDNPFDNCEKIVDTSLEYTIDCIRQSEFFIGLSSGLSWVAWALDTPVVMISNFTEANHEFSCTRITNTNVCHGCWNDPKYKFDKGDWNWCPVHKGTDRQFECHKSITGQDVIKALPIYQHRDVPDTV